MRLFTLQFAKWNSVQSVRRKQALIVGVHICFAVSHDPGAELISWPRLDSQSLYYVCANICTLECHRGCMVIVITRHRRLSVTTASVSVCYVIEGQTNF